MGTRPAGPLLCFRPKAPTVPVGRLLKLISAVVSKSPFPSVDPNRRELVNAINLTVSCAARRPLVICCLQDPHGARVIFT